MRTLRLTGVLAQVPFAVLTVPLLMATLLVATGGCDKGADEGACVSNAGSGRTCQELEKSSCDKLAGASFFDGKTCEDEGFHSGTTDATEEPEIINAAKNGDWSKVKTLATDDIGTVNATDKAHDTLLILATRAKKKDVVEILMQKGADANLRNAKGDTALFEAIGKKDVEIVKALLDGGANPETVDHTFTPPLCLVAHDGDVKMAKLLLDHGAKVNSLDTLRQTPLFIAEDDGHKELAQYLRQKGGTK